jgi:hypothetical protein
MGKFKVGDKVRVIKNIADEFDGVKIGDIGKVVDVCDRDDYQIYLRINKHDGYGFKENELELVEENKMEKTFREVIADIKEGEVWESNKMSLVVKMIEGRFYIGDRYDNEIDGFVGQYIPLTLKFKLKRKEYTFAEAFKAYEEGKGIESCKGIYYKKDYETEYDESISMDEIRGKWYIND